MVPGLSMLPIHRIWRRITAGAVGSLVVAACLCFADRAEGQPIPAQLGTPRALLESDLKPQPEQTQNIHPTGAALFANGVSPGGEQPLPIVLVTALRLAGTNNL